MTLAQADMFVAANRIEAGLWIAIGLAFAVVAVRRGARGWRACAVAAVAFIAFGVSDLVETTTGAWWRPWWLLAWKGTCLVVFAALLANYARQRRTSNLTHASGPSEGG